MNEELTHCFLCHERFEDNDQVIEFFGGLAHYSCFDNKMKDNARRNNINNYLYQKKLFYGW